MHIHCQSVAGQRAESDGNFDGTFPDHMPMNGAAIALYQYY